MHLLIVGLILITSYVGLQALTTAHIVPRTSNASYTATADARYTMYPNDRGKETAAEEKAKLTALAEAKKKAQSVADSLDMDLGELISISDYPGVSPEPSGTSIESTSSAKMNSVDNSGQATITVSVTYELKK